MRKVSFSLVVTMVLVFASFLGAQKIAEPAIGGYCPVAYKAANKPIKGKAEFSSKHDGQTFYFVNADAKKMFDDSVQEYTPLYHGYCAAGVAKGMKIESDPTLFTVFNGKTYLFSTKEAKQMFDKDKSKMAADADNHWPSVAKMALSMMP